MTQGRIERSGKNINGYFGETIDVAAVLRDCVSAAKANGWSVEDLSAGTKTNLLALRRPALPLIKKPPNDNDRREAPSLYISAGIHGDEPAGPLAVCRLLKENQWPSNLAVWICPCLNPTGFLSNRRENSEGLDLNRQY